MVRIQQNVHIIVLSLLVCIKDLTSLTISVSKSSEKALLGNNLFTLECAYTLQNDILLSIEIKRLRSSETLFTTIVTYKNPLFNLNATYQDLSLISRTEATSQTLATPKAALTFNEVQCEDKATYQWDVIFYTDGNIRNAIENVTVVVKAETTFASNGVLSNAPSSNIKENDIVTFTCEGDAGNEPTGQLGWYYYLNNITTGGVDVSSQAIFSAPVYNSSSCSYSRTSRLVLTMTKEFNNIIVRCTMQQEISSEFGEGYKQQQISVQLLSTSAPPTTTPVSTTHAVTTGGDSNTGEDLNPNTSGVTTGGNGFTGEEEYHNPNTSGDSSSLLVPLSVVIGLLTLLVILLVIVICCCWFKTKSAVAPDDEEVTKHSHGIPDVLTSTNDLPISDAPAFTVCRLILPQINGTEDVKQNSQ